MLQEESLLDGALQRFLGVRPPEMPSCVRIVKLVAPWEHGEEGDEAEVHVEVNTHSHWAA